ncbi:MAG: hypothetical protein HXX20_24025 [Chloroflexi bacterium]|nr:hypothetical protein [Chloroflexota bacterium]
MQIIEITWGGTFSTGGYENEKLSATALVDQGQSPDDAMKVLREFVLSQASRNVQDSYEQRRRLLVELDKLEKNVERARQEWASVSDFLKAQGQKADTSEFPVLKFLAGGSAAAAGPKLETEQSSVVYRDLDSSSPDEDAEEE